MTVNVDTYVLPEDSNSFLSEVLPTSNPLRVAWEVLTVEEKEGYLAAAVRRLENLNYKGERVRYYQALKFPRITRNIPPLFDTAPSEIKRAQVYWAAEIMKEELFEKRRNVEACNAMGIVFQEKKEVPKLIYDLLNRWLTSWRKI